MMLECPHCRHRWGTTYAPDAWESCPECRASFSFAKPRGVGDLSAPAPSVEPHEIDCLTHAGVDECRCAEKRQWRVEQAADRAAQDRAAVVTWLETRVADTEAEVNALDAWLANTGNAFGREWESKEAMRDAVACRLEWLRAELAALHADPPKEPKA